MNRTFLFFIVIVVGALGYVWFANNHASKGVVVNVPAPVQTEGSIEYTNSQYGFRVSLPQSWRDYSVVTTTWEGYAVGGTKNFPAEHGSLISIRNPKWTAQKPYQDIPVMVFTLPQWDLLEHEQFSISGAPVGPSELGHNSKYVFALPARYNYAFPAGFEEVQSILDTHPLHTL